MLCTKCFKKNQAILNAVDLSNAEHHEKKLAELPPKPSSKKGKKKTSRSKKKTSKFKVGDYVMSKFPGYGDQMFKY